MAALACGLIAIGSCNGDVTSLLLQTMMERSASELKESSARFLALGLGLAYLGEAPIHAIFLEESFFKEFYLQF